MRLRALLLSLALATLACNTLFPTETAPPATTRPDTATPGPTIEEATSIPEATTAEDGPGESTPTVVSVATPEPPPAGVRACDYDPLISVPAEMPAEVALAATPTPFVVEQPANTAVDASTTERQLGVFRELVDIIDNEYVYIDLGDLDFPALKERLKQNEVQEKLTAQWIDRCLKHLSLRRSA